MKIVEVTIPIVGVSYKTVEVADDATEDDIFKAASDMIDSTRDIDELSAYHRLSSGNVSNVEIDEMIIDSVTHIEDEEEE